ncbi:hypothetical protein CK203_101664 [Vitis vinifera]|uniref:Retrotransposon gag protein n=1 Tax=Vitis vinifera TaxID=29760 RepID=A0A438D1V5_VITVI|nr:hypothetical protein CK203_101664 [Vitis vinifera]
MNFMSYVAEVSREWGEPNARDMGRMTSQPKVKGEMYILNDGMDMKAEIAAMERRLDELEMNQMQPVQAISQTPLQAMPCAICLSYEHLVDECPTIPAEREMFGDCNTYNSNWRDHPNFSWKPQPPQYKQYVQALPQASSLEQVMVNLCKVVGDFVGKQEAINAQINQRIDSMESTLNKRMDEIQNDMAQKLDILQDSISRLANLNIVQEKENSPSQPYQNSMSIHEMEAEEGEPSQKREAKEVITLRSGKEVDLPTCKLEHKVENETEKEKREEIKGKKKGKSIEKDDYDFDIAEEPLRIVIKEELMKKHMPPLFLQALYEKIIQRKPQRNCKEIEEKKSEQNRSKIGVKRSENREKQGKNRGLRDFAASAKLKFCCETSSQPNCPLCEPILAHECHFAAQESPFRSCESGCEPPKHEILHFAGKAPFGRVFGSCEADFGTRVPFRSTVTLISQLRNGCEAPKRENSQFHSQAPFRRVFRNCEAGFGTRVPFRSTVTSFRSCEMAAKSQNVKNLNFTTAPPFRQLLDTSRSLPEVQIIHAIYRWKA